MNARFASILLTLILCGAVSCAGCQDKPRPTGLYPVDPDPKGQVPPQFEQRILAQDPEAAAAVFFVSHRHGFLPTGQIQISVNLESRILTGERWLEWRAVFYDADRFPVEETEWHPIRIGPSVVHTVKAQSISPGAKDYTLFVRSVK